MKPITFVTTFSAKGYKRYGKTWIDTFIRNTAGVNAIIYTDFELQISNPRITILNFNVEIPNHKEWLDLYNASYTKDIKQKKLGVKFSYKSFVIMHALQSLNGIVIWLDGDCTFKQNDYLNFASNLLNNKFIAAQVDKVSIDDWKTEEHVESGIVIFDADHRNKNKFLNNFKSNYSIQKICSMDKPYDGFILMRSIYDIEYEDLFPMNYTVMDYNPLSTLINTELRNRFTHNIGNKNE